MKLLSAAASTLLVMKGAASQVCPNSISSENWNQMKLNDDTLTFNYAIVLASSSNEQSILCARLESDTESFIGFGISPTGRMAGGEGIIGLPDAGTVKKYTLGNVERTKLMSDEKQTLMHTNITQTDGKTVMEFAKYLLEEGEHEILVNGDNVFLYALGRGNDLGRHTNKGDFTVDFETTTKPPSPTPDPTPNTPAPTPPNGAITSKIAFTMALGAGVVLVWFGI
mmetsp:Transcript_762/g.1557  ORF Transcript_762/g.1557 Transcript_762/m.1557 type:complete len:225 (-) Transcript_762:1479-2153(-)